MTDVRRIAAATADAMVLVALAASTTACDGSQSSLAPGSPAAASIATLWWVMLGVAAAVYVLVMVPVVLIGRRSSRLPVVRGWTLVVGGGIVAPAVVTVVFVVWSALISRSLTGPVTVDPVSVQVTAHQWWWDVSYLERDTVVARTANELHLPVNRPVRVRIETADVIHSFWVPSLAGKIDAIPGVTNELVLNPTRTGIFRGQCAEFCGGPHALMSFLVIVEPAGEFEQWLEHQARPSRAHEDPELGAGLTTFLSSGCARCHRIDGTPASGRDGPDLTHLAGRRTLAAGTVPNTIGHLGGWLLDPQSTKPGALMPPSPLEPRDFRSLLRYLRSLE